MIILRDIFKPRYALIAIPIEMPIYINKCVTQVAVMQLPYKRPWNMPFNYFYMKLSQDNQNGLVFCGSKRTLKNLYGIGSTNKDNINNPILVKFD